MIEPLHHNLGLGQVLKFLEQNQQHKAFELLDKHCADVRAEETAEMAAFKQIIYNTRMYLISINNALSYVRESRKDKATIELGESQKFAGQLVYAARILARLAGRSESMRPGFFHHPLAQAQLDINNGNFKDATEIIRKHLFCVRRDSKVEQSLFEKFLVDAQTYENYLYQARHNISKEHLNDAKKTVRLMIEIANRMMQDASAVAILVAREARDAS